MVCGLDKAEWRMLREAGSATEPFPKYLEPYSPLNQHNGFVSCPRQTHQASTPSPASPAYQASPSHQTSTTPPGQHTAGPVPFLQASNTILSTHLPPLHPSTLQVSPPESRVIKIRRPWQALCSQSSATGCNREPQPTYHGPRQGFPFSWRPDSRNLRIQQ